MRTRIVYILCLILGMIAPAHGQALWRNFFTTNQNPVVDVVAGSNATVQATTVGVNTRRFTVNSVPPTQLPYTVITNSPWMTNGSPVYASNVVSGGQLPMGTVSSDAVTTGGVYFARSGVARGIASNVTVVGDTNLAASSITLTQTNDADALDLLTLSAGTSSQYKRYFRWMATNSPTVVTHRMGVNRDNTFIIFDNSSGVHSFFAYPTSLGGSLALSANPGTGITLNNDPSGASTNGVLFYSGGLTPVIQWKLSNLFYGFTPSGNATFWVQVTETNSFLSGNGSPFITLNTNGTVTIGSVAAPSSTYKLNVSGAMATTGRFSGYGDAGNVESDGLRVYNAGKVAWSGTAGASGAADTSFTRASAGTIQVNTNLTAQGAFTSGASASNYLGASVTASNLYGTLQASNLVGSVPITLSGTLPWANLPQLTNSDYAPVALANLGTPAAGHFPIMYCSDAITSWGTGAYVRWDGSNWRTWESVIAANTIRQYLIGARASGLNVHSPLGFSFSVQEPYGIVSFGGGASSASGTGASAGNPASSTPGTMGNPITQITGTDATGYGRIFSWFMPAQASGDYYSIGCKVAFSIDSGATDKYWSLIGFNSGVSGYPTTGCYWLYDASNANGHGISATNNWHCVTALSSSYTVVDSGLKATVDTATLNSAPNLQVILTSTNAVFLTNGVPCVTNTTTIPNTALWFFHVIQKTAGTTSVKAQVMTPSIHVYRGTARAY